MIGRRRILEKGAISVLANLFRLQNFRSYLQPNDPTFPIELVLLNVVKPICLVIHWWPEWRWCNLFCRRRIIERAVHNATSASRHHRHLGVPDILGLSLRIEHQPILRQLLRIGFCLGNLEPNVQPSLAVAFFGAHFFKRRPKSAGHDRSVRKIVEQPIVRAAGVPRLSVGTNPRLVFNHDAAHRRVRFHAFIR